MPGIRIHDLTDEHALAFDLLDLLQALGEPAERSSWRCTVGECIGHDDARADLEDAYGAPHGLSGRELHTLASETIQVVDGVFEGYRPGESRPWIRLEAIDSTYWEVFAEKAADLSCLRTRFSEVETIEEDEE